ncbi:hypothetical protein Cpir12675_001256 [Ceratocystis pirilliformis]|uniref:Uncharacterized protein n=1 Tax=Ceratocystis pirilliformis TaxID=259994 RepID=A0ABR3ZH71_9PEZI
MIPATTLILALASAAFASPVSRATEDYMPLEISEMEMSCAKTAPADLLFACTLNYNLRDPNAEAANPSVNPKVTCTHRWNWDGQTAEKGPLNTYTHSTLECYSDGNGRNVKSSLYKFTGPENIQLSFLSSYYKNYETKSFRNLFFEHVNIEALTPAEDSELLKTWSLMQTQTFQDPSVTAYDPPTNSD